MSISCLSSVRQNNSPNFGMYKVDPKGFSAVEKVVLESLDTKHALDESSNGVYQVIRKAFVLSDSANAQKTVFSPGRIGKLMLGLKYPLYGQYKPTAQDYTYVVETFKNSESRLGSIANCKGFSGLDFNMATNNSNDIALTVSSIQEKLLNLSRESKEKFLQLLKGDPIIK